MTFCKHYSGSDEESETETSQTNLCRECFESEHPEASAKMEAQLEAGCRYCGKRCGTTFCPRCAAELRRVMQLKGITFSDAKPTAEQRAKRLKALLEVEEHMKKWVIERGPDDDGEDAAGDFPLQDDAVYERLAAVDGRYTVDACRFVRRAVRTALAASSGVAGEHVSGRDVALAFRHLAFRKFGTAALPTLRSWGIQTTDDIGALVFRMVQFGVLGARPEDKPEDFHALYDFSAAFPTA